TISSMLMTLVFFLTGRRQLMPRLLGTWAPTFGIREREYERFADWVREASRGGWQDAPQQFRISVGLLTAEIVGGRLSRLQYALWPWAVRWGRIAESVYLIGVAVLTACLIVLLMPPAVV